MRYQEQRSMQPRIGRSRIRESRRWVSLRRPRTVLGGGGASVPPPADDTQTQRTVTVVASTVFEAALRVRSFAPFLVQRTASSTPLALCPTRKRAGGRSRAAGSKTAEGAIDRSEKPPQPPSPRPANVCRCRAASLTVFVDIIVVYLRCRGCSGRRH